MRGTLEERFWAKVDRAGPIPPRAPELGPCWVWTAATTGDGYGLFHVMQGHPMQLAHRVAHELQIGPIPEGYTVDHLCFVVACVRGAHLEAATIRDNILRGNAPAAINARATECVNGHPFDEENTQIRRDGKRQCRTCRRR